MSTIAFLHQLLVHIACTQWIDGGYMRAIAADVARSVRGLPDCVCVPFVVSHWRLN